MSFRYESDEKVGGIVRDSTMKAMRDKTIII